MPRSFIGMDIGSESVNLAFRSGSSVQFVSRALPDNAVADGAVVSAQVLSESLRDLRSSQHLRTRDVSLVLHAQSEFFRHASLPLMSESELKLNLPYEFRDFITDDPDNYAFDYALDEIRRDEEGIPTGLEVFAAAARHDTINQLSEILRHAGFRLRVVSPSAMAFMTMLADHISRHPEDANVSLALVDVGYMQMSVGLFQGTHFEGSRLVDMGVRDIDDAIASAHGIDRHMASSYRARNYEGVLNSEQCEAIYERMVFEVSKVINFYNFSNQVDVERMYLLGTGVSIDPLISAMGEGFDQPVYLSTSLMGEQLRNDPNAALGARAYAALLAGEANVHGA